MPDDKELTPIAELRQKRLFNLKTERGEVFVQATDAGVEFAFRVPCADPFWQTSNGVMLATAVLTQMLDLYPKGDPFWQLPDGRTLQALSAKITKELGLPRAGSH